MASKQLVIVTRRLPQPVQIRLAELFDARLNADDHPMSKKELIAAAQEAAVLLTTVTDRIDAEVIAAAGPQLKMIANYGAGVDHIDLAAARKKGLAVTNTPDVLTEDTADMTLALILAVPRRLAEGERLMRKGGWTGWSPTFMMGRRVSGKRLGIVGMGRIGQAVAKRAKGFGLSIHYNNRKRVHPDIEAEYEATYWESLDQMLAHMDVVTLHCPQTPGTYHLMSERRLKLMQPHAYLVNTARGGVVDEEAMVKMLQNGELAGAGLDVFENEPAVNKKLLRLDNVVLLPHLGSATLEARVDMGERALINIRALLDGHTPPDRVLVDLL